MTQQFVTESAPVRGKEKKKKAPKICKTHITNRDYGGKLSLNRVNNASLKNYLK